MSALSVEEQEVGDFGAEEEKAEILQQADDANSDDDADVLPQPHNPGEEEVVRICVLGATGNGKSSLCNYLSNSTAFEVGDGFDSCTQYSRSHSFFHRIQNREVQFEVTDTPGWFDCDRSDGDRVPSAHVMLQRMRECMKISETGITAFLVCVPFERISIDTEQSIYFMRDCFDSTQLRHVYLVFTKCGHQVQSVAQILQSLLEQKNKGRAASALVYNYALHINEQIFVTNTTHNDEDDGDEKQQQLMHMPSAVHSRDYILRTVHDIYNECGIVPDGVFQTALKNYQNDLHRLQQSHLHEQHEQNLKYQRMMTLGAVVGVGAAAVGLNGYLKYNALFSDNRNLQTQASTLHEQTTALHESNQQLQQENNALAQNNQAKNRMMGVAETTAGVLWATVEPISGAVAILDGLSRIWYGSNGK